MSPDLIGATSEKLSSFRLTFFITIWSYAGKAGRVTCRCNVIAHLQKGFTFDTCRKQNLSHADFLNFGLIVFGNKVSRVGSPATPTTHSLRIALRCQGTLEGGCGIDTSWYDVLRMTLADVNAASLRSLCCFQPRKTNQTFATFGGVKR